MTAGTLSHAVQPAREGDGPHPGLLLLHGRGTDEHDLLPLASELDPRLFTISARGPLPFPHGGRAWYSLDPQGVGYPDPETFGETLSLLDTFIDDIPALYPVDPKRLYVAGFSMGGAVAGSVSLLFPDRIAGALILSSYLPLHAGLVYRTQDAANRPIFQAHGLVDGVIPLRFAHETRDFLRTTPVDLTYREYSMGHQISAPELDDINAWFLRALNGAGAG